MSLGTALKVLMFVFFVPLAAYAEASDNFAECILENVPGTSNAPIHAAIVRKCLQEYPDGYYVIEKGAGRGIFSYSSGEECSIDKAKNTTYAPSAAIISKACACLYNEPAYQYEMCQRYLLPEGISSQHENVTSLKERIVLEHHYREIYTAHPDADSIFHNQYFWQWVSKDKARESTMLSGNAEQIISLFSQYKQQAFSVEQFLNK